MRISKAKSSGILEGDLTPMIDMTFQLIAFFMVLINFSQAEQNDLIKLPDSVLAKPPEEKPTFPVTLHLTKDGKVLLGGNTIDDIKGLKPYLDREVGYASLDNIEAKEINIIIRAHQETPTGKVQELIAKCQESGLEKFALRVKEKLE